MQLFPYLLCEVADQDNGFRRLSGRVANRYRLRRRNSDTRIHVCTHEEIPECYPEGSRILRVLATVLPIFAGASDGRGGFHPACPASRTDRSHGSRFSRQNPEGSYSPRHGHSDRIKRKERVVFFEGSPVALRPACDTIVW